MKIEFEMTEEQEARLLDASKPVPAMFISGGEPMFGTPQENANRAWLELGKETGFDAATARGAPGRGPRFFLAEPVGHSTPVGALVDIGNAVYAARKAGALESEIESSWPRHPESLCAECGHTYQDHMDGWECQHGGCDHCASFAAEVFVDVVFDGPPSHESGRFVEVESGGRSVRVGEWIDRGDGYWALRLPVRAAALHTQSEDG